MKSSFLALVLVLSFVLTERSASASSKMYSATADVEIRHRSGPVFQTISSAKSYARNLVAVETPYILSNDSLSSIVHTLKLNSIWAERFHSFNNALPDSEAIGHLRSVVQIDVPQDTAFDISTSQGGIYLLSINFKITARSKVPQEGANIANAVVDRFKAMRDREETQRNQRGMDALRNQISQQQKVVDDAKIASAKLPNDVNVRSEFEQQQSILDALNVRLRQDIADQQLKESPVLIISRAVPPPE